MLMRWLLANMPLYLPESCANLCMILQAAPDQVSTTTMKTAYALAIVGLLAILSPVANARRLLQDSATITDNDILNFALNLEVSGYLHCRA